MCASAAAPPASPDIRKASRDRHGEERSTGVSNRLVKAPLQPARRGILAAVWRRRLVTAALLVAAGVMLSGCGVPEDGWVGVGRASDGRLLVQLRTCAEPLDGATL